jgi:hypothetical protein
MLVIEKLKFCFLFVEILTHVRCCGSGMFIPDPDFTHPGSRITDPGSRIPDPKAAMKARGEKKFLVIPFFGAIKFTKLNYFIFEMLKKKIWQIFKELKNFLPKKLSLSSQKLRVWDPRSGIRKKPIPDFQFTSSGAKTVPLKHQYCHIFCKNTNIILDTEKNMYCCKFCNLKF